MGSPLLLTFLALPACHDFHEKHPSRLSVAYFYAVLAHVAAQLPVLFGFPEGAARRLDLAQLLALGAWAIPLLGVARETLDALRGDGGSMRELMRTQTDLVVRTIDLQKANRDLDLEIQERKRTEAALRDSEARIRAIVNTAADGILTTDDDGVIRSFNPAAQAIFGYSELEIAGRNVTELLQASGGGSNGTAPSAERLARVLKTEAEREGGGTREVVARHEDGSIFPVEITVSRIAAGEGSRFSVIVRDVTERRIADEQMRRLARGLEAAGEAIYMTGPDGRILYVNPAFTEVTGWTMEDVLGKDPKVLWSRASSREVMEGIRTAVAKGEVWSGDVKNVRKNGEEYDAHVTAAPILNPTGEVEGHVSVHRDTTAERRIQRDLARSAEELARRNRELRDFVSIASHDLREPLRKVQAFGDRLEKTCSGALSIAGEDYLARIRSAAQRMEALLDGLLSFSRVTTQAKPFERVSLTEVVGEVLQDLEVLIENEEGTVEIGVLPVVTGDRLQMGQLLQNLIANGLKFHPRGKRPMVRVYGRWAGSAAGFPGETPDSRGESRSAVEIIVEDDGIGIEAKHWERVFIPFHRLHNRSEFPGTGMGLAICRKITERHNGQIRGEGVLGKGARLVVTLPRQGEGSDVSWSTLPEQARFSWQRTIPTIV